MNDLDPAIVWRDLRALVVERLDEDRRMAVAVTGLPFSRLRALRRLAAGPLTHAQLAEAMVVDRPAATLAVDDLCAKGLAVREVHPTDRRCKLVSLTAEGHRMIELADSAVPPPPEGWPDLPREDLAAIARVSATVRRVAPGRERLHRPPLDPRPA
ncbi:MarR family transcriptional regulator [Pseudonocardia spinosispora]|uniref:MarR family transcriptional regulator n=1 Tax=Pseudonocardia spinosispora TaxID=103441 RepID=UPI00042709EB|nr:MarR family transcriptional regulator [Pseudonocardia spinosispora]